MESWAKPCPKQGDVPASGRVAVVRHSQGCQPELHDPNCPKLSQSLAWHRMCLWAAFSTNQEKRGSDPGLFWKVGQAQKGGRRAGATPCSPSLSLHTAPRPFPSPAGPFCSNGESRRPFPPHSVTRCRRCPQTIILMEAPASSRGRSWPWPCCWFHWNHSGESGISISKERTKGQAL